MFASLALVAAQVINIPLGKPPPQIDRPIAPIETAGRVFGDACKDWDDWDRPAPPVRIHANTYLVGTCGISAILVTGSDGHILIDGGTEAGAELIAANIRRLGFKLQDIRYILHSHEHSDHVGGIARLQQLSGAQLIASANAAPVLNTGLAGPGDPQGGMHKPFRSALVDRTIANGGEVRLGNLKLTAHETKGHTHGALSWSWVSCDGGVCRSIVYADSLTPVSRKDYRFSDHPALVEAFRRSIERVAGLDCEILLTPHPSASDMRNRLAAGKPLLDSDACRTYAAERTRALDERLAKELLP